MYMGTYHQYVNRKVDWCLSPCMAVSRRINRYKIGRGFLQFFFTEV